MGKKISAVINTFNDEKNIELAINSVKWADEIIVCDMHSTDRTVEIAKKNGLKVIYHKKQEFVEPARNFAISKAIGDWVLILDPDERLPESLSIRLTQIASKMNQINYVRLPRKNLIFGKWMQASGWWPDYNIRFFRKGKVEWTDKIHRPPKVIGEGLDLAAQEKWAIVHYHYESVSQFLERMIRYSKVQADELKTDGYVFDWKDLIKKPLGEFLGRFFANKGYKDGLHGLSLSLLQAFSFLIVYLKVWEAEKFRQTEINLEEIEEVKKIGAKEINYWFEAGRFSKNPFKKLLQKAGRKLL